MLSKAYKNNFKFKTKQTKGTEYRKTKKTSFFERIGVW